MNPRDLQKAMKRMGIQQNEIEAEEVIIRLAEKDIVIKNPSVSKVNMMGQESFQISGKVEEVQRNEETQISDDDISTVIGQTGCAREEASGALMETKGNIAEAILKLQNK